jgi:hypothetical protein
VLKPKADFDPKFFYCLIHTVKIPEKGYARHFNFLDKADIPLPPPAEPALSLPKGRGMEKSPHRLASIAYKPSNP